MVGSILHGQSGFDSRPDREINDMKQTPILFSTEMVQAILEGRKTQTRRVVKKITLDKSMDLILKQCPYGQPGDILWVRETFGSGVSGKVYYKADKGLVDQLVIHWKPSIHMPYEACRLFLRIKSVRMERLHDISYDDAIAEGIEVLTCPNADAGDYNCYPRNYMTDNAKSDGWPYFKDEEYTKSFASLWQSINGTESWDANPWVWVVEFERIEKP
jgi:hypothetical protein